jgi:integrase
VGSVFRRKRKDARARNWYVEYSYGGKRVRRRAKGARTKSEAKAYVRGILAQIDRGEYLARKPREILFKVFAKYYMKWAKVNKRSWKRDRTFMAHFRPFFEGRMLHRMTPMLIEDYKRKRRENVTGATVNRELACLKHMFNMALNDGIVAENPVRKVRFFREDGQRERILTPEEEGELLKHCNDYLKNAVLIALNTGMRRGEILALKWGQVDLARGVLTVENTKNGKRRKIPVNSALRCVLGKLRENGDSDEFVFPNRKTGESVKNVKKSFRRACEKAGIKGFRFHDLRHTFATRLVERGVDLATVSELLGHSTIVLTKRYSHPSPAHKREAVETLAGMERTSQTRLLTGMLTGQGEDVSKTLIMN